MQNNDLIKCRNCYYEVEKSIRRCPYCGILNPTLKLKDIFIGIFIIILIMSIYTYIIR
jgi:RNA polymerase subunit RPABC4/transcription elongation factor Spt4